MTYTVCGALLAYGVVHPLTMVIYMTEMSPDGYSSVTLSTAMSRVAHAFHPTMGLMAGFFLLLGAMFGLVAGFYARTLWQQSLLINRQDKLLGDNIESLLQGGESENIEFKSSLRWDRRQGRVNRVLEHAVLKTLAAFMNGTGGTLVIGVDDDGKPMGIHDDWATLKRKNEDGFEQVIMQLVARRIGPHFCPYVHTVFHTLADQRICRAYVDPSPEPVYLVEGDEKQFFIRTGNSSRELNVEEAIHYTQQQWRKS